MIKHLSNQTPTKLLRYGDSICATESSEKTTTLSINASRGKQAVKIPSLNQLSKSNYLEGKTQLNACKMS